MKIVARNSDGAIMMVADCPTTQWDAGYTVHDLPGWDWSRVDLSAVDRTQPNWVYCQLQWNGATLERRSPPLPQPYS